MKRTAWIILLIASLTVTGCRSVKPAGPTPTPQEEETHDYTVMAFSGTVDGMSVSGQVRMDRDKVIWCSVSKIIELGRAMATPDSVWVRIPVAGRYQQGDYKDLGRLAGQKLSFADLQAILESDDPEERIRELAQRFDVSLTVKITRKEKVQKLTFPFNK